MRPVVLRPRLAPVLTTAALYAVGGTVLLRATLAPTLPFLPTALGLSVLLGLQGWFTRIRARGLRLAQEGVSSLATGIHLDWPEIARVRLGAEIRQSTQGRRAIVRYASLENPSGSQTIRFADLGGVGRTLAPEIEDVPDAALALAVVAHRRGVDELLASATTARVACQPTGAQSPVADVRRGWGLLPLLLKVGPKLWGALGAGLKLVKPGAAALSLGVYSLFFNWRFALALMLMIFWHEYGHVRAMQRIGHPVRGIYFVPFLGGLAVHNAPIASRWHRVYVDLNGPAYGLYLTLLCYGSSLLAGERFPWLAPLAAWWALINLFNLLPVLPLDGGRTLSAIAFSLDSRLGAVLVALGLGGGAVLAVITGHGLIAVVTLVGLAELTSELRASTRRRLLANIPAKRLDFESWWRLVRATRPPYPGAATEERRQAERANFENLLALSAGKMMNLRQVGVAVVAYLGLVLVLVLILVASSHQAGDRALLELFR